MLRCTVITPEQVVFESEAQFVAVPAHDERDFAFAKKYDLPIRVVIAPDGWNGKELEKAYIWSHKNQ